MKVVTDLLALELFPFLTRQNLSWLSELEEELQSFPSRELALRRLDTLERQLMGHATARLTLAPGHAKLQENVFATQEIFDALRRWVRHRSRWG